MTLELDPKIVEAGKKLFSDTVHKYAPNHFLSDDELKKRAEHRAKQEEIRARQEEQQAIARRKQEELERSQVSQGFRNTEAFIQKSYANTDNTLLQGYAIGEKIIRPDISITDDDRFKRAKDATYRLAQLDNSEQGFLDFFERNEYKSEFNRELSPEEAIALGKKYNVELKYDRPVNEGEVRFAIDRNILRKQIEDQLAITNQNHSFTGMQNLAIMGAGMAGAMPASELALTIGASVFMPEIAVGAIAKTGIMGVKASEAMRTALSVKKATDMVNKYNNSLKLLKEAGAARKEISALNKAHSLAMSGVFKEAGLAEETVNKTARSVGSINKAMRSLTGTMSNYGDSERFFYNLAAIASKGEQIGEGINLAGESALAAGDNILSSIPFMAASARNSALNQTNSYSYSDVLADSLLAGAIGAGLPIFGRGLKKAWEGGKSIFSDINENVKSAKISAKRDKVLSGIDNTEIEQQAKEVSDTIKAGTITPPQATTDTAHYIKDKYLTQDETAMLMSAIVKGIANGKLPNLSDLPLKSPYLTSVKADVVKELTGSMDNDISDLLDNSLLFSEEKTSTSVVFSDEQAMLGRKQVTGLTTEDAKDLIANIYRANLSEDEVVRMAARDNVYNTLTRYNNLSEELRGTVLDIKKSKAKGQPRGVLDNTSKANIKDSVGYALFGDQWDNLKATKNTINKNKVLSGVIEDVPDDLAAMDKKVDEFLQETGIFNKNGKIDLDKMSEFADTVDSIIEKNADLVDTDSVLERKYGNNYEELNKILQNTQMDFEDGVLKDMLDTPKVTTEEYEKLSTQVDAMQTQVSEAKVNLDNTIAENEEAFASANRAAALSNQKLQMDTKNPKVETKYTSETKRIAAIDTFRQEYIPKMKTAIVNAFKEDTKIQDFIGAMLNGKESVQDKFKKVLWGSGSPIKEVLKKEVMYPLADKLGIQWTDKELKDVLDSMMGSLTEDDWSAIFPPTRDIEGQLANIEEVKGKISDNKELLEHKKRNDKEKAKAEKDLASLEKTQDKQTDKLASDLMKEQLKTAGLEALIDPLMAQVEHKLLSEQYLSISFIDNQIKDFAKAMKNRNYASEVFASIATFTAHSFEGTNLNIENIAKLYTKELADIQDTLINQKATGKGVEGTNLWDFANDKSNKDSILEALLWLDEHGDVATAEKAGAPVKANSDAYMVAQAIKNKEQDMLYRNMTKGSRQTKIGTRLNTNKLRTASQRVTDEDVSKATFALDKLAGIKELAGIAARFTAINKYNKRLGLYALMNFDLDKTFPRNGIPKTPLNDIRDMLMSGDVSKLNELKKKKPNEFNDIVSSFEHMADILMGNKQMAGWVDQISSGSSRGSKIFKGNYSKFIDDAEHQIYFKDMKTAVEAHNIFGYDSISEQMHHDLSGIQRTYAVLSRVGYDPMAYADSLMDLWDGHIHNLFNENKMATTLTANEAFEKSLITPAKRKWIEACFKSATGLEVVPASVGTRWFKLMVDLPTSPMLINAGIKSITDYEYQHQWLLQNGLMTCHDITGWTRGIQMSVRMLQDPELRRATFYNLALTKGMLLDYWTNGGSKALGGRGLAKDARLLDKLEEFSRNWNDLWINKIAHVEPLTNIHRSSAALNIMTSLASDDINKPFKVLTGKVDAKGQIINKQSDQGKRLEELLTRNGISEDDWDFLRGHIVQELRQSVEDASGRTDTGISNGFKMWMPEKVADISDKDIAKEMQRRGVAVNPTEQEISDFRDRLMERSLILINSAADEMTTLPTARTSATLMLGGALAENEGLGAAIGAFFKFQSFGIAANQIHFGRRIAHYINTEDENCYATIWTRMFGVNGSWGDTAHLYGDVIGLTASMAAADLAINEVVSIASGKHQNFTNDKGEFNWNKITDPYVRSWGALGTPIDMVLGFFDKGGTRGGGIALPGAPAWSATMNPLKNVVTGLSKEGTIGEKLGGGLAGAANGTADFFGLRRAPFLAPIYNEMFGNWAEKQTLGSERYYKLVKNRDRRGFTSDWFGQFKGDDAKLFGVFD